MNQQDQYPVKLEQIEQGLHVLQRRQRNLAVLALAISTIGISSLVSVFFQQNLVFHLFGVSQQVQQLHIPFMIDEQFREYIHQPNYLANAFSWFGWLLLKVIVSFVGAFFVVGLLKKIKFFKIRLQSFLLKFVAWIVVFIVFWSGLSYIQHDLNEDEYSEFKAFVHYDKSIQQSEIYQYLQKTDIAEPVQDYLLAQTALMHKPADLVVGKAYTDKLIKAENTDSHFSQYGFKPEQLWTIQHQVFNQAVSPIAKSVELKVVRANFWSNIVEKALWVITVITLLLGFIIYLLSQRIGKRLQRIGVSLK